MKFNKLLKYLKTFKFNHNKFKISVNKSKYIDDDSSSNYSIYSNIIIDDRDICVDELKIYYTGYPQFKHNSNLFILKKHKIDPDSDTIKDNISIVNNILDLYT